MLIASSSAPPAAARADNLRVRMEPFLSRAFRIVYDLVLSIGKKFLENQAFRRNVAEGSQLAYSFMPIRLL
ncbi:hypothetical protein J27TS7_12580 [Paenibacillus dendritiformis]|nr:hypothetical protein J27TS7_12580 [Paenibacillus dendritiformis]